MSRLIFLDNFQDDDGTDLSDHTPDIGGPWTAVMGVTELQINGDKVVVVTGTQVNQVDMAVNHVQIEMLFEVIDLAHLRMAYVEMGNSAYDNYAIWVASGSEPLNGHASNYKTQYSSTNYLYREGPTGVTVGEHQLTARSDVYGYRMWIDDALFFNTRKTVTSPDIAGTFLRMAGHCATESGKVKISQLKVWRA